MDLTRDEALAAEGSLIAHFFVYTPARFRFKRRHLDLLRLALEGCSDAEITGTLDVLPATVQQVSTLAVRQATGFSASGSTGEQCLPGRKDSF